jgi:hypothetical protein
MRSTYVLALLTIMGGHLLGCKETGSLEVHIKRSPAVTEHPLDPEQVTHLRVRVTGKNMNPTERIFQFQPGESSTLPLIPVGDNRVITVEGLSAENGLAISRGRSLPIKIREGHQVIDLFVARIGRFSFTPGWGLTQARFAHATMTSSEGKLLMLGGATGGSFDDPDGMLSSIEVYDPTGGATTYYECNDLKCLGTPRAFAAAAPVDKGLLLISGLGNDEPLNSMEFVNTKTIETNVFASDAAARWNPTVFTIDEYTVIAGGIGPSGSPVDTVEVVTWDKTTSRTSLPGPGFGMAAAGSGSIGVLFGGFDVNGEISNQFLVFDPSTMSFDSIPSQAQARAWASPVALPSGQILIIGGIDEYEEATPSIDVFDPDLRQFCTVGKLQTARWLASTVRLNNGKILVMGGLVSANPDESTTKVEMLDPRFLRISGSCENVSGRVTSNLVPDMKRPRYGASATLLPNGTVVITGGLDPDEQPIKEIEIFVPDE